MVCCVQVMRLVAFLIDHRREPFEVEVPRLGEASAKESPAPGAEAEAAEVRQGHKQCDNRSLSPQKVGLLLQGQARSSTSLQLCKSAE